MRCCRCSSDLTQQQAIDSQTKMRSRKHSNMTARPVRLPYVPPPRPCALAFLAFRVSALGAGSSASAACRRPRRLAFACRQSRARRLRGSTRRPPARRRGRRRRGQGRRARARRRWRATRGVCPSGRPRREAPLRLRAAAVVKGGGAGRKGCGDGGARCVGARSKAHVRGAPGAPGAAAVVRPWRRGAGGSAACSPAR